MQIVQIQTVDNCNAKCVKCPHPEIYHDKKVMSDDIFLKIITDLKKMNVPLRICLFLENEPLMDPLLFKRAQLIKRIMPDSILEISTNCLALPKYEKEIYDNFDILILSLQGWDAKSYSEIHRINISPEQFQRIQDSFDRLKAMSGKEIYAKQFSPDNMMTNESVKDFYMRTMTYSRGGFHSNDKRLFNNIQGCQRDKHKILNFLNDGSMILCCMDYLRKTVVGNIRHQDLQTIITSKLYTTMVDKVEGKIQSEYDFICKKCELVVGVKNDTTNNNRLCT